MNPITHGLMGLGVAAALSRNLRDMALITACGVLADIDGASVLWDRPGFYDVHHTFGHNLFFGLLLAAGVWLLGSDRNRAAFGGFVAYFIHLTADILGTNWAVMPMWPISKAGLTAASWWPDDVIYGPVNDAALFLSIVVLIVLTARWIWRRDVMF